MDGWSESKRQNRNFSELGIIIFLFGQRKLPLPSQNLKGPECLQYSNWLEKEEKLSRRKVSPGHSMPALFAGVFALVYTQQLLRNQTRHSVRLQKFVLPIRLR